MRIVHLSDIHLSEENYQDFINDYKDALISSLREYNTGIKIDVIVITGDLVDRGGHSLYNIYGFEDKVKYPNPFMIFKEIFLEPIINALGFNKNNILFVPGNHDIDETTILLKEESDILKNLNENNINTYLKENEENLKHSKRLLNFKAFEHDFHKHNDNYCFSNNQSTFIYNEKNIGFILVNDSWRCKSPQLKIEEDSKFYFGIQQLYDGLNYIKTNNTSVNIVLMHHPFSCFKEIQKDLKGFFNRKNVDILLFGHNHEDDSEFVSNGSYYLLQGKASLLKPSEKETDYRPGYQILDLDLNFRKIHKIIYMVYNDKPNSKKFIIDTTAIHNGEDKTGYNLSNLKEKDISYIPDIETIGADDLPKISNKLILPSILELKS
jgi:predicted phosphodiesterase